jgi:quercetin dioxygenase-like cupin family protein
MRAGAAGVDGREGYGAFARRSRGGTVDEGDSDEGREATSGQVVIVRAGELRDATHPLTPMRMRLATKANTSFAPGRRDWLQYLDTGFAEASGGRLNATVQAASGALGAETGWHYHECEMQLAYILKGWIDLQYEDGTEVRLEAGDVMFLPGGVKHNEVRSSDDITGFEITIPAVMGTVPCDVPEGWTGRRR